MNINDLYNNYWNCIFAYFSFLKEYFCFLCYFFVSRILVF